MNIDHLVEEEEIKDFLQAFAKTVDMQPLGEPFAYPAMKDGFLIGYGGWMHWVTSGCHVYSYAKEWTKNGHNFFTIDCYTCKPFSVEKAVAFTKTYFGVNDIAWKEV